MLGFINEVNNLLSDQLDVRHQWALRVGIQEQPITEEIRARLTQWTDPAIPGFKFFIDFDAKTGLFADEKYVNSALAFLKRAGEEHRYNQLKSFIAGMQSFIQHWDFLIMSVEGLGDVLTQVPGQFPHNEDDLKITMNIRETIEYRFATLMLVYNRIAYDYVRGVEVLPPNLKRFTCYVLVYQQGMYSEDLYGLHGHQPTNTKVPKDNLVLPTYKKLSDLNSQYKNLQSFKNFLFMLSDCSFNMKETAKQMFNEISNEPNAEPAKNQLVINWKFGQYYSRGRGGDDAAIFDNDSEQDAIASAMGTLSQINREKNLFKWAAKKATEGARGWGGKAIKGLQNSTKKIYQNVVGIGEKAANSLVGPQSPLGQKLDLAMNPDRIIDRYATTYINGKIDSFAQKHVFGNIAKFNSFLLSLDPELQIAMASSTNGYDKPRLEVFPESINIKPTIDKLPTKEEIFEKAQNIVMPDNTQARPTNLDVSDSLSINPENGLIGLTNSNNLGVKTDLNINPENAYASPNKLSFDDTLSANGKAPKIGVFEQRKTF